MMGRPYVEPMARSGPEGLEGGLKGRDGRRETEKREREEWERERGERKWGQEIVRGKGGSEEVEGHPARQEAGPSTRAVPSQLRAHHFLSTVGPGQQWPKRATLSYGWGENRN
jgi:hypothetical protein